jgi:L-ascorbate metabolism protein UlaG (beta-lactamase superfamily)
MKLTYFGHSAYQIETNGTRLLFDPFITGNVHAEGIVTADELDPHFILLTHAHPDHWGDTVDIARRTNAVVVGTHEISEYLINREGYENVQPMNTGGTWRFEWGRVEWMMAMHSSSFPDGTYGGSPNGILLEAEGKVIYNTCDTAPFAEMAWIGEDYRVDVCLMPIGDCYTQGPEGAVRSARMIRPDLTLPLHYNTFPLIQVDVSHWERLMREAGFATRVPAPGETIEL